VFPDATSSVNRYSQRGAKRAMPLTATQTGTSTLWPRVAVTAPTRSKFFHSQVTPRALCLGYQPETGGTCRNQALIKQIFPFWVSRCTSAHYEAMPNEWSGNTVYVCFHGDSADDRPERCGDEKLGFHSNWSNAANKLYYCERLCWYPVRTPQTYDGCDKCVSTQCEYYLLSHWTWISISNAQPYKYRLAWCKEDIQHPIYSSSIDTSNLYNLHDALLYHIFCSCRRDCSIRRRLSCWGCTFNTLPPLLLD